MGRAGQERKRAARRNAKRGPVPTEDAVFSAVNNFVFNGLEAHKEQFGREALELSHLKFTLMAYTDVFPKVKPQDAKGINHLMTVVSAASLEAMERVQRSQILIVPG